MAAYVFDATKVEPDAGRLGVVPKNWYSAVMKKSPIEPTNDNSGAYINTMFQITEGPYKGAVIFHMIQIKNNSEKTVEIAHKQLSAICHAVGRLQITATEMLHDIPLKIRVTVKDAEGTYPEKNEISAFTNYNDPKAVSREEKPAAAPAAHVPPPAPSGPINGTAPPPAWTPPVTTAQPWPQPGQAAPTQAPAAQAPAWDPNAQPVAQPTAAPVVQPAPVAMTQEQQFAVWQAEQQRLAAATAQPAPAAAAPAATYVAPVESTPAAAVAGDLPPWMAK